jgi:hypothetical protein
MARYAIIIGAEQYTHFPPTAFAHADADLIHQTLTELCDYPGQHALLLKLSPSVAMQPAKVLEAIRKAVDGSTIGDSVLFYFAGHGHFADGRGYLILPDTVPGAYETTALGLDDISKELRRPERACFRVFDACHSGLDVRDGGAPDSSAFIRAVTHDGSGWVTLAACREDQYSIPDPQIGQGVFTHYFCDYIRGLKPDEAVLPELVKVGIADRVCDHARRLGYTQTPTLNASISGNISLALRRADPSPPKPAAATSPTGDDLASRIRSLRDVPNMFDRAHLEQLLKFLTESVKSELEARNKLSPGPIVIGSPIRATDIPDNMHRDIVTLAQRNGLQSRHELTRWEEDQESPLNALTFSIAAFYQQRREKKQVRYNIWQSSDLPESAVVLEIAGDGRCVPTLKVLLYVLPLQLTTCLLVSAFRHEWPPKDSTLALVSQSYQIEKPGVPADHAKELAPFAVKRLVDQFSQSVRNRVQQLEKEIKE